MAMAFEEEMNALKLVSGPDGRPQLVDEPYLHVSGRTVSSHMHARGIEAAWIECAGGWGLQGGLGKTRGVHAIKA